jgi:hypothetical protein
VRRAEEKARLDEQRLRDKDMERRNKTDIGARSSRWQ